MWLDAVITTTDLQQVVAQLTPATIPLGERGHLFFDSPEVSLEADRGLRIRCYAKLRWPILGIDVAITVRSMTLLIVPTIEIRDGNRVIVLSPEVDALDLALLPDVGDAELRSFINRELQAKRVELPWNYKETLDHQFALPAWFSEAKVFEIRSNGAAIKVTNDQVGLAICLAAAVAPSERPPALPIDESGGLTGSSATHEYAGSNLTLASRPSARSRALAKVSPPAGALAMRQRRNRRLGLAFAVASGFGLGCLMGLRSVRR